MNRLILVVLLLTLVLDGSSQVRIEVDNPVVRLVGDQISVYEDKEGEFSVSDVFTSYRNGEFVKHDSKIYSSYANDFPIWFGFNLSSTISESVWLSIDYAILNLVHFYKLNEDGEVVFEQVCGVSLGREESYNEFFPFWFPLLDSGEKEHLFLIRISSSNLLNIPLKIGGKEALYVDKSVKDGAFLFFVGGMLFILLYNLSIYFFTKEKVYLYYVFYVFFVTLGVTFVNGFPIAEYFFGTEQLNRYGAGLVALVVVFIALTTISFFNLKESGTRFYKVIRVEIVLTLALSLLGLVVNQVYLIGIIQIMAMLTILTSVAVSVYFTRKGSRSAGIFLLGWGCMLVGAVVHLLISNGIAGEELVFREIIIFPILIEALIFSIALATKIRLLKSELIELNHTLTRSNAELKSSNDAIDSFNYHVSHELKTVLNNAASLSKMAVKYISKENLKKVMEILEKLEDVTANGAETITSFLSLGQSNSLFRSDEVEEIDVKERIKEVLEVYDLNGKVKVEVGIGSLEKVFLHTKAFDTILANFLTNTVKYNAKEVPRAYLTLKTNEQGLEFFYKDNGIGIDMKKDGEKIFKPFSRIANDLDQDGTGIGMYLVKRIIQNYEGTIEVKSKLGKGIQITINVADFSPEN